MKKSFAIFLQLVLVLAGIAALVFLLWEPRIEGRNLHATLFEIYFKDPFLAYAYIASVPFFVALYTAFRALGAGQENMFPQSALKALRTIRYCALATIGFVVMGEIIFILFNNSDDRAGGVFMGLLITCGAGIVAATAERLEKALRKDDEKKFVN